jgi:hypothetical protein
MKIKTSILLLLFLSVLSYAFTQENVNQDTNLKFLEETNQDTTELSNLRGLRSWKSMSTQQLYDKVNARSDAYNPNSPRFNPTSQNNKGGKSAQASQQKAAEIWKEIRSRESLDGAAPAAGH